MAAVAADLRPGAFSAKVSCDGFAHSCPSLGFGEEARLPPPALDGHGGTDQVPRLRRAIDTLLQGSSCIVQERQGMKTITIHTDGFEGFRKRALERARKLDRGEPIKPEHSITLGPSAMKVPTEG